MARSATQLRVLLAEDDTVSRTFLREAVAAAGAAPTACADGPSALAKAQARNWDLLIFDHHLPGLNGDAVLATLRGDPKARARTAPAIATTAEPDASRAALLEAGFAEVLAKPFAVKALHQALARHCRAAGALDDEAALRACGSPVALQHLRRLFAEQELPRIQIELDQHRSDYQGLRPTLHRLRASCGFCGAIELARASALLQRALAGHAEPERVADALVDFNDALHETRTALHAKLDNAPESGA